MELKSAAQSQNPPKTRQAVDLARSRIPSPVRAVDATASSSMGRTYRRQVQAARGDDGNDLLDVQNANDIVIPNRLDYIMFHDNVFHGSRMLVFCSPFGQELIRTRGDNIGIDGTFKVFHYLLMEESNKYVS